MTNTAGGAWRSINDNVPGSLGMVGVLLLAAVITGGGVFLQSVLGESIGLELTVVALPLLLLVAFLAWHNERAWVYLIVALHLAMLIGGNQGEIGAAEVLFGVLVLGGMTVWFIKETTLFRRPIVESGFDLLLVTFIVLSTLVTALGCALNGGDWIQYFKEWGILIDLLLYFPLRKILATRRDIMVLLLIMMVVEYANGAFAVASYRERLAKALFQWQVTASRSNVNEPTSIAMLITSATIFAYARRWWLVIVSLAGMVFGLLFLVVSFSRSPILSGVLGLIIMSLLIPWRNSRRVLLALVASIVLGGAVVYFAFPQIASSLGQSVTRRLLSVTAGTSDISLNSRVVEAKTLLNDYIALAPLTGYGYGVYYKFREPILNVTARATFVHNGYIWAVYKFGFPLALLLVGLTLYPILRLLYRAPPRRSGFHRAIMAGAVAYCLCVLVMHFTSNLWTGSSGVMNFAISWAMLDFVHREEGQDRSLTTVETVPPEQAEGTLGA